MNGLDNEKGKILKAKWLISLSPFENNSFFINSSFKNGWKDFSQETSCDSLLLYLDIGNKKKGLDKSSLKKIMLVMTLACPLYCYI